MNLSDLIDPSFSWRLITTLVHFLWQGSLVAILAVLGDALLSRSSASRRYTLHVAALMLMIGCVVFTFWNVTSPVSGPSGGLSLGPKDSITSSGVPGPDDLPPTGSPTDLMPEPFRMEVPVAVAATNRTELPVDPPGRPATAGDLWQQLQHFAPQIALLYFACCGLLLARLARGTWLAHRLRGRVTQVRDESLIATLQEQAKELGLCIVPKIAWCAEVSIPLVIGVIHPMILLPAAAATGLSPVQLQALITHELAHIRRYDLLVNMVQRIVESILFFHPAVWFISRRISSEREQACDELVLATGCERLRYADALVRMAELSSSLRSLGTTAPATSLAAAGSSSSEFKRRVLKILSVPTTSHLRPSRIALLVTMALIVGVAGYASGLHAHLLAGVQPNPTSTETMAPEGLEFLKMDVAPNDLQLADVVRDFNAENKQLGRGVGQAELTVDEIIAVIKQDKWARGNPWSLNEKEIAAFKSVAESKRLPKGSRLDVHTENRGETFLFTQLWQVHLMLPAMGHDGLVGLTIRDTRIVDEKIDPTQVAWGKPDADGLVLGAYFSPRKANYALGERVRLRLFVRNNGSRTVDGLTFYNLTTPAVDDFNVTDETGAKVAVRLGHDDWSLHLPAGATTGVLAPGGVHAFNIPFELAIGGKELQNRLIGRVISARPGQKLQLKVRAHNGSDRPQAKNEPRPESGTISFTVTDAALPEGLEFLKPYPKLHGLSLEMTEPQFLEIVQQQGLNSQKSVHEDMVTHHLSLGDGQGLIVMFTKNGKCKGIQRIRGANADIPDDKNAEGKKAPHPKGISDPGSNEMMANALAPFQGNWAMDICDSEIRNFGGPQDIVRNWRWAIQGNEVKWTRSNGEIWKLAYSLDPMKSPREIDFTYLDGPHKGEKSLGMYQWGGVNGKMLQLSIQNPGAKVARPKSISMTGGGQTSLVFLQPVGPDEVEKELASLQGTWQFDIIQTDGWPKPKGKGPDKLGQGDDRQWKVKGNEITWVGNQGEEVRLAYTIDPTKAPKQIDVTFLNGPHKGKKCPGIYERGGVAGVLLWLCLNDPGVSAPRPSDVSYSTHEGRTMIGLYRVGLNQVGQTGKPGTGLQSLRKPSVLLPDHWIMQAVGFDRGGKELVTASNQSFATIRRWDVGGLKLISEIKLQADKHGRHFHQETLKFSGDRKRIVGATDAYVGIWDTTTGKLLKQLPFPKKEGIYDCAIDMLDCTPDLSVIVGHRALPGRLTLSFDAHVLVWNGDTGEILRTVIDKGATDLKALDLSTDGKRLVTTNGGGAKIWEMSSGLLLRTIANDNKNRLHSEPDVSNQYTSHVWSVQLSPDGNRLAMGDILGVKLIDVATGKLLQFLEGPYRYSSTGSPGLVFAPDGERLARLGTQEKGEGNKHRYVVPIWSTRTGAKRFELHAEANVAAFSDDGQFLAVGFSDMQQALSLWSLSPTGPDGVLTSGPGPHSRIDRVEENGHYIGKKAAEYIEQFKPTWGEPKLGLQYGIALTKPQKQFRSGERVPLVVFFRNTSDKPIKFDTAPDFFGNPPKVLNAKGEPLSFENIMLLGDIPHYHETLQPGEALGPFYLSIGLGENPRPNQQNWYPYLKDPVPGTYSLTHSVSIHVQNQSQERPMVQSGEGVGPFQMSIGFGENPRSHQQYGQPNPQGPVGEPYPPTNWVSIQVPAMNEDKASKRDQITSSTIVFEIVR